MRAPWLVAIVIALGVTVDVGGPAHAQPGDVPSLIQLIESQPSGMDRPTWKEKRREAARKLVASRDKRAVPVLIKLVENETFDIIGEIAIEGLGELGEASAAPALQRAADDVSRDRAQRDLARRALAKLGAPAQPEPTAAEPAAEPESEPEPTVTTITPGKAAPTTAPDAIPGLTDDVLAASERLTFLLGQGRIGFDTVRDRTFFDADAAAAYQRRVEKTKLAYGWNGDARVIAGYVNPDGPGGNRAAVVDVGGDAEVRPYLSGNFYATAAAGVRHQTTYVSIDRADPGDADLRDARLATDLQLVLGAGWGRVLEIGSRLRVRRIAAVLEQNRALGRAIDDTLAARLQRAWWSLRGARSTHSQLVATVSILREAGVILGEPDASLTYQLLEVLRDPALDRRASGLDLQIGFAEGYLMREDEPPTNEGRVEQVIARARWAQQLPGDTSDLGAEAFGHLMLFGDEGEPAPWALGVTARFRRFAYLDQFDPVGVIDISASAGLSDDDLDQTDAAARLGGEIGWSFFLNRASAIRIAGSVIYDNSELFALGTVEATWGLFDGSFAKSR